MRRKSTKRRTRAVAGVLTAGSHATTNGRAYGRLSIVRLVIKPGRKYWVREGRGGVITLSPMNRSVRRAA